jgi:hypothetical protein
MKISAAVLDAICAALIIYGIAMTAFLFVAMKRLADVESVTIQEAPAQVPHNDHGI